MANATTVLKNITANPIPLPVPYKGIVYANQEAFLVDPVATVIANLGGAAAIKSVFTVLAIPSTQTIAASYHDQSIPTSSPGSSEPPSGPAGGDLAGNYPNPTIAPGAIDADDLAANAVTAGKIAAAAVTPATTTALTRKLVSVGSNGVGPVTFAGAAVGDIVALVLDLTDLTDVTADFEATISVAGQIQQTNAANLSAKTCLFLLQRQS